MSLPARKQRVINYLDGALCKYAILLVPVTFMAVIIGAVLGSEQALSPPSHPEATTKDPSRVC